MSSAEQNHGDRVWSCRIGPHPGEGRLLPGSDNPMRKAVEQAYVQLVGKPPVYIFSGWGDRLSEAEQAVVENREPDRDLVVREHIRDLAIAAGIDKGALLTYVETCRQSRAQGLHG